MENLITGVTNKDFKVQNLSRSAKKTPNNFGSSSSINVMGEIHKKPKKWDDERK